MNEVASCEDLASQQLSRRRVAIIGSGPGGLVAARYLKHHGFEPVVFEQDEDIGGQWNVRSPHSGVWPSMVTNTSRWLTCFSDLALESEAAIFPSSEEILALLDENVSLEERVLEFQIRSVTSLSALRHMAIFSNRQLYGLQPGIGRRHSSGIYSFYI
jgi:cation diffusion facilitator CzcD-associated flavoprotein CzcO